ncbi:MAG TPA: hypothetical protein VJC21_04215 [Candidatus Nanoarchaeia archaeon]|nr:hypothetical protein [Candidatus Nanoarchaeia archaeon]
MTNTQEIDELLSFITGQAVIPPEREQAIECIALASPRGEEAEMANFRRSFPYTGTLFIAAPNGEVAMRKGEPRTVLKKAPTRRKVLASGLLALAALQFPFSCEENHPEGITISGVVIEEQYVPATIPGTSSQYFFFLERPERGRQAVEVQNYYEDIGGCRSGNYYLTKESIDFLIAPGGSRVEISGLTPEELSQGNIWQVPANRIRVYQLEE